MIPQAPFFACLGYSRSEAGLASSVTVGFKVNAELLKAYMELTGNKVEYGAIIVGANKLDYTPLDENGEVNELLDATVFKVKMTATVFECKIVGFNENQLDIEFMLGAYIIESKDGVVSSVSYMQKSQVENGNYEFISYNTVNG